MLENTHGLTHYVRYSSTLSVIRNRGIFIIMGFHDPGKLPLVDPVILHLTRSKSDGKQISCGQKSEIRRQKPDKVSTKRDMAHMFKSANPG